MKLYYRADSRSPNEIFINGFRPRVDISHFIGKKPWWMLGLRYFSSSVDGYVTADASDFSDYEHYCMQPMDADINHVVSISTKFETTPIFPINQENEVYVYVMGLPEATIPEHIDTDAIYDDIDVFDLHALQIRQGQAIINANPQENPGFVAQGFCGYEAFTQKIDPSQIIGVVKCKRSDLLYNTAGTKVFPSVTNDACSFDRQFQVQNKFICNSYFTGNPELRNKAIEKVFEVKAKGVQPTSSVLDALRESRVEYNEQQLVATTFFWNELVHLNFLKAASSVLASIQYFFTFLYRYMTGKYFTYDNQGSKYVKKFQS